MEIRQTIKKVNGAKRDKFVAVLHRNLPTNSYDRRFNWYDANRKSKEHAVKILDDATGYIKSTNAKVNYGDAYIGIMFNSKEDIVLFKLTYG